MAITTSRSMSVKAALDVLVDFYAQLALRGGSEEVAIPNLESASPVAALDWARSQSHRVASDLIEDRTCAQCHEVERIDAQDSISWSIPQVYLTQSPYGFRIEADPCGSASGLSSEWTKRWPSSCAFPSNHQEHCDARAGLLDLRR